MPTVPTPAPQRVRELAASSVEQFATDDVPEGSPTDITELKIRRRSFRLSDAYPVYVLKPTDLRAMGKRPLERVARFAGWRVLVRQENSDVARVDMVAKSAEDEGVVLSRISHGPSNDQLTSALDAAKDDGRVQHDTYEVRLLRVPALYVTAAWLKDLDGRNDLFFMVDPVPPRLRARLPSGRGYTLKEVRDGLVEFASQYRADSYRDTPKRKPPEGNPPPAVPPLG